MTSPSVSWVMPARNAASTIADSITSILAQSFTDWELIVVDDGSSDETGTIVNRYAERDSRIRVLTADSIGTTAARNLALQRARGRWIAVLDADDIAVPTRLDRQTAFMRRHPQLLAVVSRGILFVRPAHSLGLTAVDSPTTLEDLRTLKQQRRLFVFCHSTVLFDAEKLRRIGGYDESFAQAEDAEVINRGIYAYDFPVLLIDEPLTWYRISASGMSTRGLPEQRKVLRYLEQRNHRWLDAEEPPSLEEFMATPIDLRTRLRWKRHDLAAHLYRKAGIGFGEGHVVRPVANVALATALHPRYAWNKARRQRRRRSELERLIEGPRER